VAILFSKSIRLLTLLNLLEETFLDLDSEILDLKHMKLQEKHYMIYLKLQRNMKEQDNVRRKT
jgi:hypothetical protein